MPLLRKAEAIFTRLLGPNHPTTASVQSQEGVVLTELGELASAERVLTAAVASLDRCTGCTYEMAVAKTNLGLLRIRQKKFDKAGAILGESLVLEEKLSLSGKSDMATTLRLLAEVRDHERRPDEAARLRQRASGFVAGPVDR